MNTNGFQTTKSGWLIVWEVIDVNDDNMEDVAAVFKDARKAADYALNNGYYGVQMSIYKPDWNFKTED